MLATMAALAMQAAAVPAGLTAQQRYDRAQAAYDRGDWQAAADGFGQLVDGMKRDGRAAALIRVRMADALTNLGRIPAAREAAAAGLETLRRDPPDIELANAWLAVGTAARFDLAYADAVAAYRAADALAGTDPSGVVKRRAAQGIMLSAIVTDPAAAALAGDAVLAGADFATRTKLNQAELYAIRARIELNRGSPAAALPFIRKAVALHGPMDNKVSLADVTVRGDAALVHQLLGNRDEARRYMAFTGAGHLPSMAWLGGDKTLPTCDDEVRPEDTAVVEFAIAADGRITGAAPIYASRPGEMGVAFAQAVRGWRLRPDEAAKLAPFWRASVRLQLRCMTRPAPESIGAPFHAAARAWLEEHGRTDEVSADVFAPLLSDSALAAAREAAVKADDAAGWRAAFAPIDAELVRRGAPTDVRAAAASNYAQSGETPRDMRARRPWRLAAAIPLVDAMPGSAPAAAWLRTEMAFALERAGDFAAARPVLEQVMAVPVTALSADDPIRAVATLHLSMIDRRAGDQAAADARLMRAGLNADSCALYDVRPVATNMAISSAAFPGEALAWGFEGYVREAFDVNADGSVAGVRTVIAYPPFVFTDATEKVVRRFRYEAPSLGGKALGCSAQTVNVNFRLPR